MGDASHVMTDFRSGEWSPYARGRVEDREYNRGLNVCLNGFPIEAGAWTRRTGTRYCGYSRGGAQAWLQPFNFSQATPYISEFTDQHLQVWSGTVLVMTNDPQQVVSVSTANPAVVTTLTPHGWNTNDRVMFLLGQGVNAPNAGPALNRRYTITSLTSTTFSLADELTGAPVVFGTSPFGANQASVGRILDLASPYTRAQIQNIKNVIAEILVNNQLQGQAIYLHPTVAPQVLALTNTPGGPTFANFTFGAVAFKDGPYLDPPTDGSNVQASNNTGSVTITASVSTFLNTDVGRFMRFYSAPQPWASGTAYVTGNTVLFNNVPYTAQANSTNKQPDLNPTLWFVTPTAAKWAWGTITAVTDATHATVTLALIPGDNSGTTPLLYAGSSAPITVYQMGLWSGTTGYPTCGVFHEGRLWLAGAQPNRFDCSMSNAPFIMSPTDFNGNVNDNNAISYVLNSDDVNKIVWLTPDHQGLIAGTAGGEWLLTSGSNSDDPMTPTNIKDRRITRYKAASVPPIRAGLSLMFVQAQLRRLMEYTADVFSGKFLGRNMTERGRHLTGAGIRQTGWQQDLSPTVWLNMNDGSLAGLTYKRESQFTSEAPTYYGWHRHTLGSARTVESLAVGPSVDGSLEAMTLATNDPSTLVRHIEIMTDMFDETTPLINSWFLDDAAPPSSVVTNETTTPGTATLFGYNHLIGKTVSVVAGGLDLGDYLVAADGSIQVPLGATAPQNAGTGVGLGLPLFTPAFLSAFTNLPPSIFSVQVARTQTVTHASATSQFIQTFHDTSIVTGANIDKIYSLSDYQRNEFHTPVLGNTSPSAGWIVYNRQTTALKRAFTQAQIFGSTNYAPGSNSINGPYAMDDNGFVYWFSGLGNNDIIRKMDTTSGKIVASFGVSASSFNNDNNFIQPGRSFTCIKVWQEAVAGLGVSNKPAGFRNYLLSCPIAANSAVTVLAVDDITTNGTTVVTLPDGTQYVVPSAQQSAKMQWAGFQSLLTEKFGRCCTGASYTNGKLSYGDVWIVGEPNATTAAYGFYRVRIAANAANFDVPPGPTTTATNPGITMVRTGGITPAQIDATWTNITSVGGVVFDKTDGNLILWFQTTDAVATKQYIVKINPGSSSTAPSVVWKTGLTAAQNATGGPIGANSFYVGYGTIAWLIGTALNSVATSSGALTTTTVAASTQVWDSYSDDRDAMMLFSDGSQIWHNLINVAGFASQTSITTDYNLPALPMLAGFTYNSDGQILPPIAPEQTGARNGPAFGKTKRNHKMAVRLANSQGIYIGPNFAKLRPLRLYSAGVNTTVIPVDQLATGTFRESIEDDNAFDGMVAWRISRPYPCTVTIVGAFLHTQDI